jgi:hypothetical protein
MEKGGKPNRKPYSLPYGLKNPYRNLKSENSQDYAQKPQRNCTFMNSASGLHINMHLTWQNVEDTHVLFWGVAEGRADPPARWRGRPAGEWRRRWGRTSPAGCTRVGWAAPPAQHNTVQYLKNIVPSAATVCGRDFSYYLLLANMLKY